MLPHDCTMNVRLHSTLEILSGMEEEDKPSLQQVADFESEERLQEFLSGLLDFVHNEPLVLRYTKKGFTQPKLVVFDLDSTLVRAEYMGVIGGMEESEEVKTALVSKTLEAIDGMGDWTTNFIERVRLLRGKRVEELQRVYQALPLTEGAEELVHLLHTHGIPTAIISGAWSKYVQYIADKLQITEAYGSIWEESNGYLTGEMQGSPVGPQTKVEIMELLARKYGVTAEQIVVVADGHNDLPMMAKAGCTMMLFTTQEVVPTLEAITDSVKDDLLTT